MKNLRVLTLENTFYGKFWIKMIQNRGKHPLSAIPIHLFYTCFKKEILVAVI